MSADLSHIDIWLFDLDNTLYPPEAEFMSLIEAKMTRFVARETGLPPSEAFDDLRQAIEKVPSDTKQSLEDDPTVGAMNGLAETLAVIEYRIAEVFAQLTGVAPL